MKKLLIFAVSAILFSIAPLLLAEEQIATSTNIIASIPVLKIDSGDTAWMLIATAMVMLMSLPGLAIFYGGLARRKNILNTMAMTFVTFCIISVLWVIYGYSFSFGGIIGNYKKILLTGVGVGSISELAKTIPEYIFIVYQMTFAAITVSLISGAYIERIKFSIWIIFSILWFTLVYIPIAHWIWGGGFLAKLGALDFAGGTVVHINAGIAALVGVLVLGKRKETKLMPNNLTLVIIGTGLLWFGWFGFNAGSALSANGIAGLAFINTNTAAAVAALSWMFIEWIYSKKPTILGLASGAIGGLVAITPAAGFVNIHGAIIIGFAGGILPFFAVTMLKRRLGYDDALDVFGIHGVGGIVGALLTGIFATPDVNESAKGLLFGNGWQLIVQLITVLVTILYSGIMTFIIFMLIKIFGELKVNEENEIKGIDESEHGETEYSK